jgi:hypothetical protein
MTGSAKGSDGESKEDKLPLRDWMLLPLLSLLTIALLGLSTRAIAKQRFRESTSTTLPCLILNDSSTGVRAIPNTVCWQKAMESEYVEYRFNSCGHRDGAECGPKPPDTYRIVMIGSSFDYGMYVPQEKSFAALLPGQLSTGSGRRVDLYNEAMQWGTPASMALRFHQALTEQPDMVLWALTPVDVADASVVCPFIASTGSPQRNGPSQGRWSKLTLAFSGRSIPQAVQSIWGRSVVSAWEQRIDLFRNTPSGILLQHLLYADRSLYLKSYLLGQDNESGFLKTNPTENWQRRLQRFERYAAEIERQANAAGVPLVAVLIPNRAQAAMISMGEWPAGYDPYKLDNEVRAIIESHGGIYVSILPDYRTVPNPERHYFMVDGHPDAAGHAMIAGFLAKELTAGAIPALKADTPAQVALAKGQ